MKASNELKQFLQAWLDWAEAGGCGGLFSNNHGLCFNCSQYDVTEKLMIEMCCLFDGNVYPFGEIEYDTLSTAGTQHQDPNRLAWVKAALSDTLDTWELME